jgi:late competence protein required for DNA uptake (superfamily II DNA/RNA helicase)
MGDKRNAYRTLVGKPQGKRPLVIPRCRWVSNNKMDLKRDRLGWYGMDRSGSG